MCPYIPTDNSLVTPHFDTCKVALDPLSLLNHRVLEADDLEQAELLARFWQPDIVLLDKAIPDPCLQTTLSAS